MTNQWEIPSAKLSLVIRIGAALDLYSLYHNETPATSGISYFHRLPLSWPVADPGGGGPNRPRPPLLSDDFNLFVFFFFACHPGGRCGRRTVPLPNNVNVGPKNSGGKMCRSPPPPPPPPHWATFSGLAGNLDSRPPLFTNRGSSTDELSEPRIVAQFPMWDNTGKHRELTRACYRSCTTNQSWYLTTKTLLYQHSSLCQEICLCASLY